MSIIVSRSLQNPVKEVARYLCVIMIVLSFSYQHRQLHPAVAIDGRTERRCPKQALAMTP